MRKLITIIFLVSMATSCNKTEMKNTPLSSVIKLHSSESLMDFVKAEKYIDIAKVYSKNPEINNPKEEWKKMVTFFYNIGNDKKITNQFKYHKYDISTNFLESKKSQVTFKSLDTSAKIKKIVYSLEIIDDIWKIVDIEYIN